VADLFAGLLLGYKMHFITVTVTVDYVEDSVMELLVVMGYSTANSVIGYVVELSWVMAMH